MIEVYFFNVLKFEKETPHILYQNFWNIYNYNLLNPNWHKHAVIKYSNAVNKVYSIISKFYYYVIAHQNVLIPPPHYLTALQGGLWNTIRLGTCISKGSNFCVVYPEMCMYVF